MVTIVVIVLVAWRLPFRDENDVYMTIAKNLGDANQLADVAFLSRPTRCNLDNVDTLPSTLGSKAIMARFFEANGPEASPVRLTRFEGIYNVVSWDDTKQIAASGNLALHFRPTSKRLISFSRVGFGSGRSEALLCVESRDFGALYFLKKGEEGWTVVSSERAWGH